MNVNPVSSQYSTGAQPRAAAQAGLDSLFSQALAQCREQARASDSSEDISSMKDFCDKVFLPDWLERMKKLDEMQEEDKTLEVLYTYLDALIEQAKEENRLKMRGEQLDLWLGRSS